MFRLFILVERQIYINFAHGLEIRENEYYVCGVTKLRNEIYLLCQSMSPARSIIRVFKDQRPFLL